MAKGHVIRQERITRSNLQDNRTTLYVFGDNMAGAGFLGQAAEMRGEPNAVGIPTKWRSGREPGDYFSDADWRKRDVRLSIKQPLELLIVQLLAGHNVVIPANGIGTGLAELSTRAPLIYGIIKSELDKLARVFP